MTRIFLFLFTALSICSCNSESNEKGVNINTADTALAVPPGTHMVVDTDDHNKGVVSEVALDSPVGRHYPADTIKKY